MGGFERFCWVVTILASLAAAAALAGVVYLHGFAPPQETVLAAVGIGIAIVPYVFTRSIQALGRDGRRRAAGKVLPAVPAADPLLVPEPGLRVREMPPPAPPPVPAAAAALAPEPGLRVRETPPWAPPPGPAAAAELAPEPALRARETPPPFLAVSESPAMPEPVIASPALDDPPDEPSPPRRVGLFPPPPRGEVAPSASLVATERLVPPPPPPPKRSALERAFWILIGILVVIIIVGIILIRNGP